MTSFPHFVRSESTLSTSQSVFFHVSCDAPNTWINNIFHNSRYGIFHMYTEGGKLKLELTSSGLDTIKFRKCTVKSEDGARNKIAQWAGSIMGDSIFMSWSILTALHITFVTIYCARYTSRSI